MATNTSPPKRRLSHADSVPPDHFDVEGCAALTQTLSRMSQQSEAQPARRSTGSAMGTLVESAAGEEKFDFADRLKSAFSRMDEEGIKRRELGVGFVVSICFPHVFISLAKTSTGLDGEGPGSGGQISVDDFLHAFPQELAPADK